MSAVLRARAGLEPVRVEPSANGIVAHAAKALQLNRTTLTEKIRRYGID